MADSNGTVDDIDLLGGLLAGVPEAVYFRGIDGRFIRVSETMASLLRLKPPDLVGKAPLDVLPRDQALALDERDAHVLRTGEAEHHRLEKHVGANDADVWASVTRLPLRDRLERIVGVVVMFRDVTEERRAMDRLQTALVRRDQFLAMLSHELRNPLGAVVTATALLKPGRESPEKTKKLISIIDRQSQQMSRLLDDLLEVSRMTQNKIELRKRAIDLGTVAKDAVDAVRPVMIERGVQLTTDIEATPMPVDGDSARLIQVQVNLLNNAAKYTPKGGHVLFQVRRENDAVVIRVCDDGVGIPDEMIHAIFDLFVQSRRTIERAEGGLGVGLALVRSIVTLHGGTVTCVSGGRDRGSEFVVRLPLASATKEEPRRTRRLDLPKDACVVIVEDDADSRDLLIQLLSTAGFECHAAETGPEGLALVDAVRPHVALIDVGLPDMDGFAVARRIRSEPRNAHVSLVALTGYGRSSDRAHARDAGFDEHLVKPIDTTQLLELLGGDEST